MTRNLRHLDLAHLWCKEKVADGTCVIKKVDSNENNLDIRIKVPKKIFDYLTHNLIARSLRNNSEFNYILTPKKYNNHILRISCFCNHYAALLNTGSLDKIHICKEYNILFTTGSIIGS